MKLRLITVLVFAVAVSLTAATDSVRAQKLQQAIDLIESKGDMLRAIPLLEDAATSTDASVAARALLYLGKVQESNDKTLARTTYERILNEHPTQVDVARLARSRLAAMSIPNGHESVVDRVVFETRQDRFPSSLVTADGRLFFSDFATGAPAIRNLKTSEITKLGTGAQNDNYVPRPSVDGKWVAYSWVGLVDGRVRQEIRIIAAHSGSQSRTVWPPQDNSDFREAYVLGWSADGKSLLLEMNRKDRTWQFAWLSIDDGQIRVLASTQWRRMMAPGQRRASLSPDNRYLAYSAAPVNPSTPDTPPVASADERIYVLALDGSSQFELTQTAGLNRQPIWSPDGSHVLFLSGRAGSFDLWAVAVQNGKPRGNPFLIKKDLGLVTPTGMSADGSYYYVKDLEDRPQIEFANLHPLRADFAKEPKEPLFGGSPKWAPNGELIAVMRRRTDGKRDLIVRSLQTGQETKFSAGDSDSLESAFWFNDNRSLLVVAYHPAESEGQRRSLYRADLRTGELKELSTIGRFYALGGFQAVISPDDSILYVRGELSQQRPARGGFRNFTAVDLGTGVRRKVIDVPNGQLVTAGPALSRDGRILAFVTANDLSGLLGQGKLARVNIDGSDYRELALVGPLPVRSLAWSADGLSIVFAEVDASVTGRIMSVPSAGGTAEFTGLQIDGLTELDVAATGDRIAYNRVRAWQELRAIDNVRAVLKAQR